jgi:transcriptional regulator with PAS, ATPase and Fis domain
MATKPPTPPTREEDEPVELKRLRVPGVVVVFAAGEPALDVVTLVGGKLVIGREGKLRLADDLVSREHAEIAFDEERWTVRDLGSRNGTFADGVRVTDGQVERVVRIGHTLLLLVPDASRFLGKAVEVGEEMVVGPTLAEVLSRVRHAARTSDTLLLTGESGTGKELAARLCHASGPHASGPFVAVNCAAIPEGVAERLLFGARKGAFSGAIADADGYLQAADRGTLFLDELAELDPAVQAKLLRAIETKSVLALGAAHPRPVAVKFCMATNADLRDEATSRRFRPDLYFRVGQPEVKLPAVRERLEDVPWLVRQTLRAVHGDLVPHARLVETCLLRRWPGNVRELCAEVRRAGHAARTAGRNIVGADDLSPSAGADLHPAARERVVKSADGLGREEVEEALRRAGGKVSAAARALGIHRTQLRRLLEKLGLEP